MKTSLSDTYWIRNILLVNQHTIQGYLNAGVDEQKRYPKGCDILKL